MAKAINIFSILLIFYSCDFMQAKKDKAVTSILKYRESGMHHQTSFVCDFTQKTVNDSLYILKYTGKFKYYDNRGERIFFNSKEYFLVADTNLKKQQLILSDTSFTELWLVDFRQYNVDKNIYDIYKFYSDVYVNPNFTLNHRVHFWCPDFGIIRHHQLNNMCSWCSTVECLVNSTFHEDRVINKLNEKIENDRMFRKNIPIDHSEFFKTFPGGRDSLLNFIKTNTKYPQVALKDCIHGSIIVQLNIDTSGNITSREIYPSPKVFYKHKQAFINECSQVIDLMPKWNPIEYLGKHIKYQFNVYIKFELPDESICKEILEKRANELAASYTDRVFLIVEQQPKFPGGAEALQNYLRNQIKFPEKARSDTISGIIHVSFIIESDGKITNVEAIKAFESKWENEFEKEAILVIKNMPKWEPGKQRGIKCRVKYVLPVEFNNND